MSFLSKSVAAALALFVGAYVIDRLALEYFCKKVERGEKLTFQDRLMILGSPWWIFSSSVWKNSKGVRR